MTMARRKAGGKRKGLYVECQKCKARFEFWTHGHAYEKCMTKIGPLVEVKIKFVGTNHRVWPHNNAPYKLHEFVHGDPCGGKLKRLDIPDPIRKVMPDQTTLECGHPYRMRSDMFGPCPGTKRACRECGRKLRIEAVRSGLMEAWEVGI